MSVKYQHYSHTSSMSWRYHLLRPLCTHSLWIDPLMPIFGNKSVLETALTVGIVMLALVVFFTSGATSVGNLTDLCGGVLVLLALRKGNIVTFITGVSFEHTLFFHKVLGVVVVMGMLIHGIQEGLGNSTSGMLLALFIAIISASYLLTNINFQWFYFIHVSVFGIMIIFAFMHGAKFFALANILWMVDLSVRYGMTLHHVTAKVRLLSPHLIRIEFPKVYEHSLPGQYVFLAVKALNGFEYHPFTLCSSPHSTTTIFYIQVRGDWTTKLKQLTLDTMDGEDGEGVIDMCVEGPYGSLSVDLLDHETYPVIMLLAGGIGITPLLNILSTLLSQCQKGRGNKLVKVLVVWSIRDLCIGDSIYQDFLHPIVEDSRVIHQSYSYSNSFSHKHHSKEHLMESHGGALNIPRNDIFEYFFHCTDPTFIVNHHENSNKDEIGVTPSPLHQTSSASSTNLPLSNKSAPSPNRSNSNSGKEINDNSNNIARNSSKDEDAKWLPGRANIAQYFQRAASLLLQQRKKVSHDKDNSMTEEKAKEESNHENKNQTRIAVFSCGSESFLDEVRIVQQRFNRNSGCMDIKFDLHEEMFMF